MSDLKTVRLTLHQAADVLNASTAHMKSLLEQELIAHHAESTRLRIDRDSLLAYKARDDQERQAALDELTREVQEKGLRLLNRELSSLHGRASRLLSSVGVLGQLLSRHSP